MECPFCKNTDLNMMKQIGVPVHVNNVKICPMSCHACGKRFLGYENKTEQGICPHCKTLWNTHSESELETCRKLIGGVM